MSAAPSPKRSAGDDGNVPRPPKTGDNKKRGGSASAQATKRARRGEPLRAENPQQRSPKQENL